ncbi:MAG: thioredoxin domain-containing protein [Candidatus Magasanikbacteria bacterium]
MLKNRHIFFAFFPGLIIAGFGLFFLILQYEPLYPKENPNDNKNLEEMSLVPILPADPILGNRKASKTIIVFEDFSCSACADQSKVLDQLLEKYSDQIKIIWKPLSVHKFPISSEPAHVFAYCSQAQGKFREFSSYAFTNGDNLQQTTLEAIAKKIELDENMLKECLSSQEPVDYLRANEQIAKILQIQSVPAVFVDGKQVPSPAYLSAWETVLSL